MEGTVAPVFRSRHGRAGRPPGLDLARDRERGARQLGREKIFNDEESVGRLIVWLPEA